MKNPSRPLSGSFCRGLCAALWKKSCANPPRNNPICLPYNACHGFSMFQKMRSDLLFHHFGLPFGTLFGALGAPMAPRSEKGTSPKTFKNTPLKRSQKVSEMTPDVTPKIHSGHELFETHLETWSRMGPGTTFSPILMPKSQNSHKKHLESRAPHTFVHVFLFAFSFLSACFPSCFLCKLAMNSAVNST